MRAPTLVESGIALALVLGSGYLTSVAIPDKPTSQEMVTLVDDPAVDLRTVTTVSSRKLHVVLSGGSTSDSVDSTTVSTREFISR